MPSRQWDDLVRRVEKLEADLRQMRRPSGRNRKRKGGQDAEAAYAADDTQAENVDA